MRLAVNTRCPFCGHTIAAVPLAARGEVSGVHEPSGGTPREFVPEVSATGNSAAVTSSPVQRLGYPIAAGDATTPAAPFAHPAPITAAASSGRGPLSANAQPGQDGHLTARLTDPATSHEAGPEGHGLTEVHRALIAVLLEHGPCTDYDLSRYASSKLGYPMLRTSAGKRRHDLMAFGLVQDSGHKGKTDTGARAIRWALTERGMAALQGAAA